MDILVENCPNAVLKRTVAAAKLIKSCGNGTRGQLDIKRKQKENILGEETADSAVAAAVSTDGIHSFQSQESRLRLRRVVANLRTATLSSANCASGNSGMIFKRAGSFVEVPSIEELLPKILQDLREVYVSMDTFRNEEARSGFFRRVSVQLQTVKVVLRLWSEFENALEGYEHENVSPEPSDLVPAVDCAPDIPWVKACRNELCFPRYQRREEARKTGEALMTTEQYMPRGGILILRDWSLEVGHIVQSILDTVTDAKRTEVIALQKKPDIKNVFHQQFWKAGQPTDWLIPTAKNGEAVLEEKFGEVQDPPSSIAGVAARLVKRHIDMPQQAYIGYLWKRYFTPQEIDERGPHTWAASEVTGGD